jgi:hypothetical protein
MWKYVVAACFSFLAGMVAARATPSPSPSPTSSPSPAPTTVFDFAKSRLDTMLRTGHADSTWFSATFLAQIPASKVDDIVAQLKDALGDYRSIELTPTKFVAHFAKGEDDVLIHLDAENKIDGLLFRPPVTTP